MLVSILINCYNGEQYLKSALESVLNQTYENWELIFIDNSSSDRSKRIFESYKNSKFRYVRTNTVLKLGEARNFGMSHCAGEIISFLDVDDIWYPNKLMRQVDIFKHNPRVGLCYTSYNIIRENGLVTELDNGDSTEFVSIKELLRNYDVGMSAASIRRQVIVDNSIEFNSAFSLIEDFDFFLRIARNCDVLKMSSSLMTYRMHSNSETMKSADLWGMELKMLFDELSVDDSFIRANNIQKEIKWLHVRSINAWIISDIRNKSRFSAFIRVLRNLSLDFRLIYSVIGIVFGEKVYRRSLSILKKSYYQI